VKNEAYIMFRLRWSGLDTSIDVGLGVENLVFLDSHFVGGFEYGADHDPTYGRFIYNKTAVKLEKRNEDIS
jgi:hypothetical protein